LEEINVETDKKMVQYRSFGGLIRGFIFAVI
jgi:hypothetical protein